MLQRIGGWYLVVIFVCVAAFGVGTAITLNSSLMKTTGGTFHVVVTGFGDLVGAATGSAGNNKGNGNGPTFSFGPQTPDNNGPRDVMTRGELRAAKTDR